MKKRAFALALACALSLSLLTACGSEETTTTPETTTPGQTETVEPETQTPETEAPEVETETSETETPETETPETKPEQAALKLSHSDVTLKAEGNQFTLSGNLEGEKLYYGSENESIATVDENGVVTAVALGVTNIVVETEDGRSEKCIVRCTWEEKTEEPEQTEKPEDVVLDSVSMKAFVDSLAAQHGENFAANADVVEFGMHNDLYPGLSDIPTKQMVIYQPMMGAVVCEIALVEVENAADVDAVKGIFQNRINVQVDGGAWYPESIEGWQNNSRIVSNGNYVMMIAWQFCDDAVASFNALF